MNKKLFIIIILILSFCTPAFAKLISITSQNSTSHVEYVLSLLRFPIKRKALPVIAHLDLNKNYVTKEITINSITLQVSFTSTNPLFRTIINYDQYPGFTFTSTSKEPIIIKNNAPVKIAGDLSFHGITKNITVKFTSDSTCDNLALTGTIKIKMGDFGLDSPLLRITPVDKTVHAKVNLNSTI